MDAQTSTETTSREMTREQRPLSEHLADFRRDLGRDSYEQPWPGQDPLVDSKVDLVEWVREATRGDAVLTNGQARIVQLDINSTCERLCDGQTAVNFEQHTDEVMRIASYVNSLQRAAPSQAGS